MTTIIGIVGGLIGLGFIINKIINQERDDHWESVQSRNLREDSELDDQEDEKTEKMSSPDTLGLMFNTLNALGYQPTKSAD